jgi:hypothetical protein
MVSFIEFIVGLTTTIILGFLVKPILENFIPKPVKPKGLDDLIWDSLSERIEGGNVVGFFERVLFLIAFWLSQLPIIAVWLGFKIASKWEVWKNIIKLPDNLDDIPPLLLFDARKRLGNSLFTRFIVGTLLNVLIGAMAAYIGLHFFDLTAFFCTIRL